MLKDQLKKQQPIVYRALENACANDRVMNAYLFSGPYGTMKNEAALLLAQSIFCSETNGLACEECNTCRRVREGLYTDLIVLDGKKKAISKEMVDSIQEQFSKTSLEGKEGKRVYIIQNAETASISAQNSMLKFLEEPGSGVTAILTTDNINRLLPTIVSRCTVLPFLPQSAQQYYQDAVDAGIPAEDAYLVSHIIRDPSQLMEFYESELYQKAVMMLKQFLNIAPYFWDEFFKPNRDFEFNRDLLNAFLSTFNIADDKDTWWNKIVSIANAAGVKNGDVAMNLRVALTGRTNTPDLYSIMQVMGEKRVLSRVQGALK